MTAMTGASRRDKMATSKGIVTVRRPEVTILLAAVLAAAGGLIHLAVVRPHLGEGLVQGR
ncbi:hypothetical protein [Pseudonocardia nigra]|jgi:hypothetical protein|uniref:hypothetical protein n=1 Tax=Pseudonocardia nigra TaxID=1921578 RepID=UPI001C5D8BDE|nr:hypothetical protein [Pseudonocardia nigra]